VSDTDEAEFWSGIGPASEFDKLPPGAAQQIAETLGYRYEPAEPAGGWPLTDVAPPGSVEADLEAARAEIADLRDQLAAHDGPKRRDHDATVHAEIRTLRDEIARLAPNLGDAGLPEMRSIVDQARRVVAADFPLTDRCGCTAGQTPHYEPVTFHRRGSDGCRAE